MLGGAFLTKGKMYDTLNKFNALKDKENVTVLGIESSCDETAASVVRNGREVLSSVISSQINIHRLFGGVVPEVASRNHTLAVNNVIDEALEKAGVTLNDIDAIAVTYGAGLVGALLVGVTSAKALSYATGIPLVKVNHIPCERTDFQVKEGALLSLRGKGRVRLSNIQGLTKKQRIGISLFRYE